MEKKNAKANEATRADLYDSTGMMTEWGIGFLREVHENYNHPEKGGGCSTQTIDYVAWDYSWDKKKARILVSWALGIMKG